MRKTRGQRERDTEIDRREYDGCALVLLEDRGMLKPDGTSGQYIVAVEVVSKEGHKYFAHKRYISDLIKKKGYMNAKEGARSAFLHPEGFKGILGDDWAEAGLREKGFNKELNASLAATGGFKV